MRKNFLWMAVSGLMALSLVMAACGPAEVEEEEGEVIEEEVVEDKGPIYGGTITRVSTRNPGNWDPTEAAAIRVSHMQWTSNELMQGDWTKGPQGTGETEWEYGFLGDITLEAGELADSWELPDNETIIYNINRDAKYHDLPPANGRDVTAADVVWNIEMQFNYPRAWQTMGYPPDEPAKVTGLLLPGDSRRPTSVRAIDEHTVEVKVPAESQAIMLLEIGDNLYTNPPEIWVGDGPGEGEGMGDWTKIVGSGPFIMTDFSPDSRIVYTAFKDYFETDPLFPGNKTPYVDDVVILIIPDTSTQQAALRTGLIDMLSATPEDGKQLLQQLPDLQYLERVSGTYVINGRLDQPDKPWADLRVRRAANMAVDQRAILRDFFDGEGVLLGYPYPDRKSWQKFFTPLEEMPKVQELFSYDPEGAKALLAEAGYPDGFKVDLELTASRVDEAAILVDYLSKVGIIVELKVLEAGAYSNKDVARSYEDWWYGSARGIWAPFEQLTTKSTQYSNNAMINDTYFDDFVGGVIGRDMVNDPDNYIKVLKEAGQYELELAWGIWMPAPFRYNLWHPYIKNYMGVSWTGWANISDWHKFIWIDEEQKKAMGFKVSE